MVPSFDSRTRETPAQQSVVLLGGSAGVWCRLRFQGRALLDPNPEASRQKLAQGSDAVHHLDGAASEDWPLSSQHKVISDEHGIEPYAPEKTSLTKLHEVTTTL